MDLSEKRVPPKIDGLKTHFLSTLAILVYPLFWTHPYPLYCMRFVTIPSDPGTILGSFKLAEIIDNRRTCINQQELIQQDGLWPYTYVDF